ncbi:hypothetical protein VTJ04DRAFT_4534 [Mycothermus thermophilus]|uniref:uncharacterized protein n=1 Tax=Humicola insolens TaxID=85995 RepID=UPI003742AF9D
MAEPRPPSPSDEKTTERFVDRVIERQKEAILQACRNRDLDALRDLAESRGGFLTDELRAQAWPVLLGLSPPHPKPKDAQDDDASVPDWKTLPRHRDEDQVQLDVNRAFTYYPNDQTDAQLTHIKSLLSDLIVSLLRLHPYLCYFQGYHDIAQVLLLTLPASLHLPALTRLSLFHIRDFMLPSLAPAIAQLRLLPEILRLADPPLYRHLARLEPFFALSGTLTMYAHDVPSRDVIARLFDALLAREPVFSVYLFAAIVRARRDELFDTPAEDTDMLHFILSKLPSSLDVDGLITQAAQLFSEVPPERLPSWKKGVSKWSVLKTERFALQLTGKEINHGSEGEKDGGPNGPTLPPPFYSSSTSRKKWLELDLVPIPVSQARVWFDKHVAELRRREQRDKAVQWLRKNRRPAGLVGLAVLVGVLAVVVQYYSQQQGRLPAPVAAGLGMVERLAKMAGRRGEGPWWPSLWR